MPFGDGTGPTGQGPGTGRGSGGRGGRGRSGRPGAGPGGNCVCPSCGKEVSHQPGQPCSNQNCPECDTRMVRE